MHSNNNVYHVIIVVPEFPENLDKMFLRDCIHGDVCRMLKQ